MRPYIRVITVCVNYDDILKITLVRNARHFPEILVVTSPADTRTKEVVSCVPSATIFETDAFHKNGRKFNKGLAVEEAFDRIGRQGWILVLDADILLPDVLSIPDLIVGKLYTASRVIFPDLHLWYPEMKWGDLEERKESIPAPGFFQLFHADDPHISTHPWYGINSDHAGWGDYYFQKRWSQKEVIRLPIKTLHLGPHDSNWFGRTTFRLDDAEEPKGASTKKLEMLRLLSHYKYFGVNSEVSDH